MKTMIVFCLIALGGCAAHRGPASLHGQPVAYDSMALGNIEASAVKHTEKQDVCFDITVKMKGVKREEAQSSNWTVAWVDKNKHYHLLNLNSRDPASVPQGGQVVAPYGSYQEWSNTFHACAPQTRSSEVKTLILTPKAAPYAQGKEMNLTWE